MTDSGSVVWPLRKPFATTAGVSRTAAAAADTFPVCTALANVVTLEPNEVSPLAGPPNASRPNTSGNPIVALMPTPSPVGPFGSEIKAIVDVMPVPVSPLTELVKFCEICAGIDPGGIRLVRFWAICPGMDKIGNRSPKAPPGVIVREPPAPTGVLFKPVK